MMRSNVKYLKKKSISVVYGMMSYAVSQRGKYWKLIDMITLVKKRKKETDEK
jgi:uncharacterized membrane protein YfhO